MYIFLKENTPKFLKKYKLQTINGTLSVGILGEIYQTILSQYINIDSVDAILSFSFPISVNFNINIASFLIFVGACLLIYYLIQDYIYRDKMLYYKKLLIKKEDSLKDLLRDKELQFFSSIQFYSYDCSKCDSNEYEITIKGMSFVTNDNVNINGVVQSKCVLDANIFEQLLPLNNLKDEINCSNDEDVIKSKKSNLTTTVNNLRTKIIDKIQLELKKTNRISESICTLYRVLHILSNYDEEVVVDKDKKTRYLDDKFEECESRISNSKKTGLMGSVFQDYAYIFTNTNPISLNKTNRIYTTFKLDKENVNIICLLSVNGTKSTDLSDDDKPIEYYTTMMIAEIRDILLIENKEKINEDNKKTKK